MKKDGDVEPVDRLDVMNAKLDEFLAACGEIEFLKNEISGPREELKSLKDSLEFAERVIERLKEKWRKQPRQLKNTVKTLNSLTLISVP